MNVFENLGTMATTSDRMASFLAAYSALFAYNYLVAGNYIVTPQVLPSYVKIAGNLPSLVQLSHLARRKLGWDLVAVRL